MTSRSTNSRTRSLTRFSSSESRLLTSIRSTGRFSLCVRSDVTAIGSLHAPTPGATRHPTQGKHRFWRRPGQSKSDGFNATNLHTIPSLLEYLRVASRCKVQVQLWRDAGVVRDL